MVVHLRRSSVSGLFLLTLLGLLLGCTPAADAPTPVPPPSPAIGTLTLWYALPEEQTPILQGLADEWASQQSPPVRVVLERSQDAGALHQKLLAAIQSQATPTLAFVQPPDIAAYVEADALLPLDPFLEGGTASLTEADLADYYTQFFESVRYPKANNALYAWPVHRYQTLLFLNRTRALELGGTVPPTTWDDLVQLCAAHTAERPTLCMDAYPTGNVAVLWVWSHDGSIVDEAGEVPTFQGTGGQAVMQWLGALRAVDGVSQAPSYQAQMDAFAEGRTLFTFDSTEAIPLYEARINSAFDMMVLPPPSTNGTPITVATGGNVAIFRSDPATEALAWSFLRYWTDTEANYRWADALGAYPVRRSALVKLDEQWPDFSRLRQAAEWLPYARSEPLLAAWPEIEQALAQAMINTINGDETPEEALTEAARKAQGYLDQ